MRRDDGVAGLLVLTCAAVLCLAGVVVTALAAVGVARHRAAGAADQAALAVAAAAFGDADPCAAGARVAEAVGATLVACALDGAVADVVVDVRPRGGLGALGTARARARAGPSGSGRS